MTIRVLIADDQELVRTGFRLILEATDEITVVGEAADGRTAVDLCRRLRPDVALLDIRMPVLDGLEATRLLAGPDVADPIRVVVVTTFDLDEYVYGALLAGARGFLLKDCGPELLAHAVRAAADGRRAIAMARSLRPDVCLLDIRMPDVDGIEATRQLAGPDVADPLAVVVITTFDLDEYVYGALKAGARGFLLKDAGAELLTQAVHAAARGDALIAPNITARLLSSFADNRSRPMPAEPVEPLTAREEQVLLAAARGRTNSEIGDELSISLSTVKTHLAALMRKLNARNRVEIVMWAYETRRVDT